MEVQGCWMRNELCGVLYRQSLHKCEFSMLAQLSSVRWLTLVGIGLRNWGQKIQFKIP